MASLSTRSTKSRRNTSLSQPVSLKAPPQASVSQDLHGLISKRAYELHTQRGYRSGSALADCLDAEQEILSQAPPV